jgi:predicted RNase H-like nuclease (RuvC/YqgF family)
MSQYAREFIMKPFRWLAPVFFLIVAGCDSASSPSTRRTQTPAGEAIQRQGREIQDTASADDTKKLDQYREQIREDLDRLQDRLTELQARVQKEGQEAKERLQPQIDALKKKTEEARKKLDELKDKSAEAWKAAKPELDNAVQSLKEAFTKAADQFKK